MDKQVQGGDGGNNDQSSKGKRPRNIKVKILERQGQTVLVEYGQGVRVFVPAAKLKGNDVGEDVLGAGIPHGEDWTAWVDKDHGEAFSNQLHASQIYTKQDFLALSREVRAALQRIYVNPKMTEMLHRAAGG